MKKFTIEMEVIIADFIWGNDRRDLGNVDRLINWLIWKNKLVKVSIQSKKKV